MRVATAERTLEASHMPASTTATIQMNAMAVQILSSNIYTDKPLAVVRELAANALDAHRAADNDAPFEIYLPTQITPAFRIRDYGTGLSHEDIMGLYVSYFGSTKRQSNAFIGAFGLGSKTPLAYTDRFTVISRYAHQRREYLVYLDAEGMPVITLLDTSLTDEHNGLEVVLQVKPSDCYRFESAAQRVLPYFPSESFVVHGTTIEETDYWLRDPQFGFVRNAPSYRGHRVVMGSMAYALDTNHFYNANDTSYITDLASLDLFFEIGELSIQASREALSYDRATLETLRTRLRELQPRIETSIRSYIDSFEGSPLERYQHIRMLAIPERVMAIARDRVRFQHPDVVFTAVKPEKGRMGNPFDTLSSAYIPERAKRFVFIWVDATRHTQRLLQHNPELLQADTATYFVRGNRQHIPALEAVVGKTVVLFDDLYLPPLTRVNALSPKIPSIKGLQVYMDSKHGFRPRPDLDLNALDPKNTVYVLRSGRSAIDEAEQTLLDQAEEFRTAPLLYKVTIIGVPRSALKHEAKLKQRFLTLHEFLRRAVQTEFERPRMQRMLQRYHNERPELFPGVQNFPMSWLNSASGRVPRDLRRICGYLQGQQHPSSGFLALLRFFELKIPDNARPFPVLNRFRALQKTHPLLFIQSSYGSRQRELHAAYDHYCQLIHNEAL